MGDVLQTEFNGEAILVNGFQKSASLVLVHLEAGAEDSVALLFENQ